MFRPIGLAFLAAAAALTQAGSADAATRAEAPVLGWSAMAGVPTEVLLEDVQGMPVSDMAIDDQPYCASDAEIVQTLRHDFAEDVVDTAGFQGMGTQLWGSDEMGTWTLVATRANGTSCIIASGTGFSSQKEAGTFYDVAGLNPD